MASENESKSQPQTVAAPADNASDEHASKEDDGISTPDADEEEREPEILTLVDELGVEDLTDVLFGLHGKIFSAAGRDSPVAEFEESGVFLRPANKPYTEESAVEEIIFHVDEKGILLNELGQQRKIIGARFKGQSIYTLGEMKPGTLKHYAAWFDDKWVAHKFYVQGEALTIDMIYRIRNRTHDGEISIFPEIRTDEG